MSGHNVLQQELYLGVPGITDPGSAGTIIVDRHLGIVRLVSAGAEARTLARPTREGLITTLFGKTVAGTITVTVTGGYNANGDTTLTLTTANQFYTFISFFDGTNYFWRLLGSYNLSNLSQTELAFLDGVTAGTLTASKALVVDGSKTIDVLTITLATLTKANLTLGASTAAAGTDSTNFGALPAGTAIFYPTTAADGTKGVGISSSDNVTGRIIIIGNPVAAVLKVYPPVGGTINAGAANASMSSVTGRSVIAVCTDSTANAGAGTWTAW